MQASPALPWDWQHGGTIRLAQAITREQLLAGVLQFTLDDDTAATIEENDGTLYIATPSSDWWSVQITSPTLLTIVPNLQEENDGPTIESIQRRSVIPISADIQIFSDNTCTQYATGTTDTVYARINTPWSGLDSGWSFNEGTDGTSIVCQGPATGSPDDPYAILLWIDFTSNDYQSPFEVGQIVACHANSETDVSGYQTMFTKPR